MIVFKGPLAFEWDAGNKDKNWRKHRVTNEECEEVFFDPHKRLLKAVLHAGNEPRHVLIGQTKHKRLLFVVFTMRQSRIRVISARDLSRRERRLL